MRKYVLPDFENNFTQSTFAFEKFDKDRDSANEIYLKFCSDTAIHKSIIQTASELTLQCVFSLLRQQFYQVKKHL